MTKTRNRKPRPTGGVMGSENLSTWNMNAALRARHRDSLGLITTVALNERRNLVKHLSAVILPGEHVSESQLLGAYRGYDALVEVLVAMAHPAPQEQPAPIEQNYPSPEPEHAVSEF